MGQSSYVWRGYQENNHKEPEPHREARLRVGSLFANPDYKKEITITEDWHVHPDIYVELDRPAVGKAPARVVLEINGAAHNTTQRKSDKDKNRARALREAGFIVVDYEPEDVNGRWYTWKDGSKHYYHLSDDEIVNKIQAAIA